MNERPRAWTRWDGREGVGLNGAGIFVWRVNVAAAREQAGLLHSVLSGDERRRASRFRVRAARDRFVATRGALRIILASALGGTDPRSLSFERRCAGCRSTEHGKPYLRSATPRIDFNVSHSGSLALIALSGSGPVGVDVERIRPGTDVVGVARQMFEPAELGRLREMPAERRLESFFSTWTAKEAYVKARGLGIARKLDWFAIRPARDPAAPRVALDHTGQSPLTVHSLNPGAGYAAAVAGGSLARPPVLLDWRAGR